MKDEGGNFVEQFTYTSAADYSLQRRDSLLVDYTTANWAEHASGNTVGALNVFVSVPVATVFVTPYTAPAVSSVWTEVKINEFVSDTDSDNEWVELFNPTTSLDIAGGYICDSRNTTSTCKVISGIIGANGWLKIVLETDSYLNNTGDSVI